VPSAASSELIPTGTEQDAAADPRRQAYIDAAQRLFFAHGYGATSMNAIAATVGGSKTTLWSLFPSKLALFEAVVEGIVRDYGRAAWVDLDAAPDVTTALHWMGNSLMETVMSGPVMEMQRLVIGEAARVPELGRVMYSLGPAEGMMRLAAYLHGQMQAGTLKSGDPRLAAQQFSGLCRAGVIDRRMAGIFDPADAATAQAEVEAAVATFMAAWGS
jgi:TetR/AcrR family transcriptional regulator, mexJK operon transcriptional repressor